MFRYSDGVLAVFMDGEIIIHGQAEANSAEDWILGGSNNEYFNGYVDEIYWFTRALSMHEMRAVFSGASYVTKIGSMVPQ